MTTTTVRGSGDGDARRGSPPLPSQIRSGEGGGGGGEAWPRFFFRSMDFRRRAITPTAKIVGLQTVQSPRKKITFGRLKKNIFSTSAYGQIR